MSDAGPVELKRQPSEALIRHLKRLLEDAEAGNLLGTVVLCNYVEGITWVNGGHIPFSTMLAAFEDWKFQTLRERSEG
jgi:hypothetical protein